MPRSFQTVILTGAKRYVAGIPKVDRGAILRGIEVLAVGNLEEAHTKQLRGPIRELITGHHRLTYFKLNSTIYFVSGFRKKSTKTPKQEIEYAEAVLLRIKEL